ncbi:cache domain-containing protein [Sneathiella sp. CAU 1612]|uniref:Cache domain-containing protein n=1 Tax=Sneathiella sedimenti TaxID=2816034 RepID=A0ABS3F5X9_9PROT|nr:cache domain-containing protein [Sneathiella sedimenti]MBO0333937.1 cache domain-containing protein [Sneathiella sedimenti]
MPRNLQFLWRFLPSITTFRHDKYSDTQNNFSTYAQIMRKNYLTPSQFGKLSNMGVIETISRQMGGENTLTFKQLKSVDYFAFQLIYTPLLKAFIQSNPTGHLISVGGGPRGAMQFNAEVDFLKANKGDFEALRSLGAFYNIQTTIIEKQGAESITGGVAWTETFGAAMMNTGAETEISSRVIRYIEENQESIEKELKENPVGYATFKRAKRSGRIFQNPLNRALVTRRIMGRELHEHFNNQVEEANELNIGYSVNVLCNSTVRGIDVSNPLKPVVIFERGDQLGGLSADNVRINIGTITHCATDDEDVQKLTYWGPMFGSRKTKHPEEDKSNTSVVPVDPAPEDKTEPPFGRQNQGVTAFLKRLGLTDEHDKLNKEATLFVGGSGLSLYDQLLALQDSMGLFESVDESEWEEYPLGYKISEAAIEKYVRNRRNDIPPLVIISRTPGKWIPPRHSHGPWWRQSIGDESTPSQPLAGSAKIQHALFLHGDGGQVFDTWKIIMDGAIAAYCGQHPDALKTDMDTYSLLKEQYQRNIVRAKKINNYSDDISATRTLEGASRQAYLGGILGFGMELGPGPVFEDENSLANMAPLTAKGRLGYLMHRAQFRAISNPVTYKPTAEHALAQRKMLANAGDMMNHVTSSPIEVQSLMQMLIDAKLAVYLPVDYANIKYNNNKLVIQPSAVDKIEKNPYLDRVGGADALKSRQFDAFIVSAIFYGKPDVIPIADAQLSGMETVKTGAKTLTFGKLQSLFLDTSDPRETPSIESNAMIAEIDRQVIATTKKLKNQLAVIESHKDGVFNIYIPNSGYSVFPNRRLAMKIKGQTELTSIELNALLGKGVSLKDAIRYTGDTTFDPASKALTMKSDIFATDVNNRESITNLVKSQSYYRFALEHLRAARIENPQAELERFYAIQNLNSRSLVDAIKIGGVITVDDPMREYNLEVQKFRPYYTVGRLAAAYISAITDMTEGNAEQYRALYEAGRAIFQGTSIDFDNFEDVIGSKALPNNASLVIISHMKKTLGENYEFAPRSGKDYFSAFVDYPEYIHKLAYEWAVKSAKEKLQDDDAGPESSFALPDPETLLDESH